MEDEEINSPETWNNAPSFEFSLSFTAIRNFECCSEVYTGHIWREMDENGKETGVNGFLVAHAEDGKIWCRAKNLDEFAGYIEKMLQMRYDDYVHCDQELAVRIAGERLFVN